MCFLGKLDSILNSNSKEFSLSFNQFKENIRARQIADVPRQIIFSHELNLTVWRLRRSTMLPVIIVSSCEIKCWLILLQDLQASENLIQINYVLYRHGRRIANSQY